MFELDTDEMREMLTESAVLFRVGPSSRSYMDGPVPVVAFNTMPHISQADPVLEKVDCQFVTVGVWKEKAEEYREAFTKFCTQYPQPERLRVGPSYIELGGIIGDQGAALKFMALGQVLGYWEMITPATMGMTGQDAEDLARQGMVMITGWKPNE